jgi:hypothetical protein
MRKDNQEGGRGEAGGGGMWRRRRRKRKRRRRRRRRRTCAPAMLSHILPMAMLLVICQELAETES